MQAFGTGDVAVMGALNPIGEGRKYTYKQLQIMSKAYQCCEEITG